DIKGEFGSEAPSAIWDQMASPGHFGARSRSFLSESGSEDLLAIPPRTAAMADCMPCTTDGSDSPSAAAIPATLRLSKMLNSEVNTAILSPVPPFRVCQIIPSL